MSDTQETLSKLITAFHILHRQGVLDEYGHVALRNPADPSTFFSSAQPANLISSPSDILQWKVADGSPATNPAGGTQSAARISPYSEHYIHSSIFARYPDVQSVVHAHSPLMVSCGLHPPNTFQLRPCMQLAGFIGDHVPIFDIAKSYERMPERSQDLLISSRALGDALAEMLDEPGGKAPGQDGLPRHSVVLQRGHGFVTWATSLEDAVYRAVYAKRNAETQIRTLSSEGDVGGAEKEGATLVYLSPREAQDSARTINGGLVKSWPSWKAEVERCGMYQNKLDSR